MLGKLQGAKLLAIAFAWFLPVLPEMPMPTFCEGTRPELATLDAGTCSRKKTIASQKNLMSKCLQWIRHFFGTQIPDLHETFPGPSSQIIFLHSHGTISGNTFSGRSSQIASFQILPVLVIPFQVTIKQFRITFPQGLTPLPYIKGISASSFQGDFNPFVVLLLGVCKEAAEHAGLFRAACKSRSTVSSEFASPDSEASSEGFSAAAPSPFSKVFPWALAAGAAFGTSAVVEVAFSGHTSAGGSVSSLSSAAADLGEALGEAVRAQSINGEALEARRSKILSASMALIVPLCPNRCDSMRMHQSAGFTLSGHTFSGDTFSGDTFSGDTFSGHMFSDYTFSGHTFSGDTFSGDTFSGDTFSGHMFSDYTFSGDTFSGDTFSGDTFSGHMFSDYTFSGDTFSGHMLSDHTFSGDTFSGDTFTDNTFSGDTFSGCIFSGPMFSGYTFTGHPMHFNSVSQQPFGEPWRGALLLTQDGTRSEFERV